MNEMKQAIEDLKATGLNEDEARKLVAQLAAMTPTEQDAYFAAMKRKAEDYEQRGRKVIELADAMRAMQARKH